MCLDTPVSIYPTELILGFVPSVFPKGGQPANQMGNGVFLKKMLTSPSPLKKTKSSPKKIEQGSSLGAGLFCSPTNHNNPGLQKCWTNTEGEEWEGCLI